MTKLYLAYGSNMNKAQMARRCPAARPLRAIVVDDARLVFRGVADLEFCAGATVPVVVWEITAACERALDRYEGVDKGVYEKRSIPLDNGETALTYVMRNNGVHPPTREYYQRIAQGYADFNIDLEPLEIALKHSHVKQAHSPETRRRHVRNVASGNVLVARRPMHIPLDKVDPTNASSNTVMISRASDELCKHGWPIAICEECSTERCETHGLSLPCRLCAARHKDQGLLPLPKPDPRYDGYNWSERAKAGTAKQIDYAARGRATRAESKPAVVYSNQDQAQTADPKNKVRPRSNKFERRTKHRNLSDYLREKGYNGENH